MKKIVLALGIFSAFSSFAQVNGPMEVCESIRRVTSYPERVTACMQLVNQGTYDQGAISLISRLASASPSEALNALKVSMNQSFDQGILRACESIRVTTSYPERVTSCLKIVANNGYSPEVTALAVQLAKADPMETNRLLDVSKNAYFMPEAVAVCDKIRTITSYPDRVTSCMATIKNKIVINGSEKMCSSIASSDPLEGIKCLASSVQDYVPSRQEIIMTMSEFALLKKDLLKARSQLERGLTSGAIQSLGDALRTIDTVESYNR